jgi:hypothetical protein
MGMKVLQHGKLASMIRNNRSPPRKALGPRGRGLLFTNLAWQGSSRIVFPIQVPAVETLSMEDSGFSRVAGHLVDTITDR